MGDVLKKIEDIEAEMARTQKNKATAGHLGMLKAKLAKLRRELITPKSQVNLFHRFDFGLFSYTNFPKSCVF